MRRGLRLLAGRATLWAVVLATTARPCAAQLLAQVLPAREVVTARPGEPVVREVLVSNRGDAPIVVRARIADFDVDESGGMRLLAAGSLPATLAGCIRFEPESFSLPAGGSGAIRVTLTLPSEGPPTRWGVLLSEVRPAVPRSVELGPRAFGELGTTFYLSSVPSAKAGAELIGMRIEPAGPDSVAVSVRVRNPGDRQVHISGEMSLADSSGGSRLREKLSSGVVLPGRDRDLVWIGPARLDAGPLRATATLDIGQPELLVGELGVEWPPRPSPTLASRP